jgi:hypothetical protein
MKKIKFLAVLAVCMSFFISMQSFKSKITNSHEYALEYDVFTQRYYFLRDLTNLGWLQGEEYLCNVGPACTYNALPGNLKYDGDNGRYYFNSNEVLVTKNGTYFEL